MPGDTLPRSSTVPKRQLVNDRRVSSPGYGSAGLGLTVESEAAMAALRARSQFNVIDLPRGLKLDLIVRKERDFSLTEFDRRETHDVGEMSLTLATPEDVLIAKLEWSKMGDSERQLVDAAGILKMQRDTLNFAYIEQWVESLDLQRQWSTAQEIQV